MDEVWLVSLLELHRKLLNELDAWRWAEDHDIGAEVIEKINALEDEHGVSWTRAGKLSWEE
jgi:hypothetical protein